MTLSHEIESDAEGVRRAIAENVDAGSTALAAFARRAALTAASKNAALALRASGSRLDDPNGAADLQRRMKEILETIVSENARDAATSSRSPSADAILFAKYRRNPPKQETICQAEDLEKSFPRSGFTLGPISFQLHTGEITALIGENAHGKTTLLRTIVGEYPASRGTLSFPAISQSATFGWASVLQHIGYLPQKLPDWHGSLSDNLYFQGALRGLSPNENETQVQYLVARLDLAEHLDKPWSALSGGFQLRFALAQVLVGRPRLLVLDEPLASLDPKAQAALLWDLRHLAKSVHNPMAVLISSQVLNPLEEVSDRVIFLREGQVKFQGLTRSVGTDRTSNMYECDTTLGLSVLQARIGAHVEDIKHNGVYYIIRTRRSISYTDMLRILQEANVEFTHCRDLGRKAMSLFDY